MHDPLKILDAPKQKTANNTDQLLENIETSPLVQKINNSNFDFKQIAVSKTTILVMAYYYYQHFTAFNNATNLEKVEIFHKCTKKEHRFVSLSELDWSEFAKIPVVVFFKNERIKNERRLNIQKAQNILMDPNSKNNAINRAKTILQVYKNFMDEPETSNKNLGVVVSHVFLTEIEEHIHRELKSKQHNKI